MKNELFAIWLLLCSERRHTRFVILAAVCKPWCAGHKHVWKSKCTWMGTCDGCAACYGESSLHGIDLRKHYIWVSWFQMPLYLTTDRVDRWQPLHPLADHPRLIWHAISSSACALQVGWLRQRRVSPPPLQELSRTLKVSSECKIVGVCLAKGDDTPVLLPCQQCVNRGVRVTSNRGKQSAR